MNMKNFEKLTKSQEALLKYYLAFTLNGKICTTFSSTIINKLKISQKTFYRAKKRLLQLDLIQQRIITNNTPCVLVSKKGESYFTEKKTLQNFS